MVDKDFDYGLPTPGVLGQDPELHNRLVWYGVLHYNGRLSVKRYLSWEDYKEAFDSTFTRFVTRLFDASTREDAAVEAIRQIKSRVF